MDSPKVGVLSLGMGAAEAYGQQTHLPQNLQQYPTNQNYYGQVRRHQMQHPNSLQQYALHKGQPYPSGNVGQPRQMLPIYHQENQNPSRYVQRQDSCNTGGELPCPRINVNTQSRKNAKNTRNVASWGACSELCRQRQGCTSWSWHTKNAGQWAFYCATMTGYGHTAHDTNVVSGGRNCGTGIFFIMQ